jgi:hypothetical protein
MYVIIDVLVHFKENLYGTDFVVKKVRSGSDLAKKTQIYNTGSMANPEQLKDAILK